MNEQQCRIRAALATAEANATRRAETILALQRQLAALYPTCTHPLDQQAAYAIGMVCNRCGSLCTDGENWLYYDGN